MRAIQAILFCLVAITPLSYSLENTMTDLDLPFCLSDLKLKDVCWKLPVDGFTSGEPVEWNLVDGKDFFMLDLANTMHCIDLKRGVHRWVLDLPGTPTHAPSLSDDCVGVVVKDRLIIAKRSNGSRFSDNTLKLFPATAPAVCKEGAYVGVFVQSRLYAVDGSNGMNGWSYRFKGFLKAAPKLYGNGADRFLYAVSSDGTVLCLPPKLASDTAPSKAVWKFQTRGPNTAEFVLAGEKLLVASEDTCLYAFDRRTGTVVWKLYAGVPLKSQAQVFGNLVFLKTDRQFMCLDLDTGEELWTYDGGKSAAALINNVVYLCTEDGTVALLGAGDGELINEVSLGGGLSLIPNASTEMLVVRSSSEIYALK